MGKIRSYFLGAIFCFSFLGLGFSQTIILKSGQKVEGKIVEQTDKYVKLEFQGVELIFYSDEISSIEQTSSGGSNSVTPQMELLYKAYTSSLNAPQPPKKEEAQEVVKPVLFERAQTGQIVSTSQAGLPNPTPPDLSGLPLKDQRRVKLAITQLQAEKIK